MTPVAKKLNTALYKKLYLIRAAEQAIIDNYAEDGMKTPMHMSRGQEAVVAGVCHALPASDQILGTYRSHAMYLSRTGETDAFFAEMYGKASGTAGGKAGSMHIAAPEKGFLAVSAVVGATIPVAVGVALANAMQKKKAAVAVFFGDGAVEQGVFWESLNFACLKKLPVLFICEDNGLAMHAGREMRHGFDSMAAVVGKFNCAVFDSAATDVEEIYKVAVEARTAAIKGCMPAFLRFRYYRYLEHVGVTEDFEVGYRPRAEAEQWLKTGDPVKSQREKLIAAGLSRQVATIEGAIGTQVAKSVAAAKRAPFPPKSDLHKDVFYEKGK